MRYAVLIDLGAMRIGSKMFTKMMSDLTENDSVEYIKFYNYNTKRHREFRSIVKELNIDVDLPLQGKKRVRIDMRQVVDAVRIAATCSNIDNFFLVCAEVDAEHLFLALKKMGKFITMGVTQNSSLADKAHSVYMFDRMLEVEDSAAIGGEDKSSKDGDTTVSVQEIACAKAPDTAVTKAGKRESVFPYSDIEMADIDERMAEIDKKILDMIDARRRDNIDKIFG